MWFSRSRRNRISGSRSVDGTYSSRHTVGGLHARPGPDSRHNRQGDRNAPPGVECPSHPGSRLAAGSTAARTGGLVEHTAGRRTAAYEKANRQGWIQSGRHDGVSWFRTRIEPDTPLVNRYAGRGAYALGMDPAGSVQRRHAELAGYREPVPCWLVSPFALRAECLRLPDMPHKPRGCPGHLTDPWETDNSISSLLSTRPSSLTRSAGKLMQNKRLSHQHIAETYESVARDSRQHNDARPGRPDSL